MDLQFREAFKHAKQTMRSKILHRFSEIHPTPPNVVVRNEIHNHIILHGFVNKYLLEMIYRSLSLYYIQ